MTRNLEICGSGTPRRKKGVIDQLHEGVSVSSGPCSVLGRSSSCVCRCFRTRGDHGSALVVFGGLGQCAGSISFWLILIVNTLRAPWRLMSFVNFLYFASRGELWSG